MKTYSSKINKPRKEESLRTSQSGNRSRTLPAVPVGLHSNTQKNISSAAVQLSIEKKEKPDSHDLPDTNLQTAPIQLNKIQNAAKGATLGGVAGALGAWGLTALSYTNPWLLAGTVIAPALLGAAAGYFAGGKSEQTRGRSLPKPKQAAPQVPVDSLAKESRGDSQIPALMHFIWLGGALPKTRNEMIKKWAAAANGCTINLWLDRNSMEASGDQLAELKKAGITLRSVDQLAEKSRDFAEATGKMPTREGSKVKGGAAGAISDLARLEILKAEGGTYMDSDNAPGHSAAAFANMRAPMGLRLGWDKLEHSENFSNDAMSAVPDHPFIEAYRKQAYANLNEGAVADINSGETERVKHGVMNATGPEAMSKVALPINERHSLAIGEENRHFAATAPAEAESIDQSTPTDKPTIRDFPKNRNLHSGLRDKTEAFSPAVNNYFQDIAYTGELFSRGSDNSWVPPKATLSVPEEKKTQ